LLFGKQELRISGLLFFPYCAKNISQSEINNERKPQKYGPIAC
jgi:hypothetical protein